jgi:hypothetical protein
MTENSRPKRAFQRLACALGAFALLLSFSGIISGCGPEAQTPVKAPDTSAAPVGSNPDEYKQKMLEMQNKNK